MKGSSRPTLILVTFCSLFVLAFVVIGGVLLARCFYASEEEFDRQDISAIGFDLRVVAFHGFDCVPGLNAPNDYYIYYVKLDGGTEWRRIGSSVAFDRIPPGHFHQVSKTCAYFYYDHVLGVTVDGGRNWFFRGGADDPGFGGIRYAMIEKVSLQPNGAGEISLYQYDNSGMPLPHLQFVTLDFGRSWKEKRK